jgi:hypothetical protein
MSRRLLSFLPLAAALLVAPRVAVAQDGNSLDNLDEDDAGDAEGAPEEEEAPVDEYGDEGDEGDDEYGDDEGEDEYDEDEDEDEEDDSGEDDSEDEDGPAPEPRDGPPWTVGRPGIQPAVGAVLFPDGSGGITGLLALGAEAYLPFYQETDETLRWGGKARVVGQVLVGPDFYNGYAARVGVFAGPSAGPARLRVGPDFFINQYVLSGVDSDPFSGVGIPLTLSLTGGSAGIYGGVEPAWYMSGGWPVVDWGSEDIFGFGDEFTYRVGANVSTSSFGLGLGYTHRITYYGVQRGISVGIGF